MKLSSIIDCFVSGDWGNESSSVDAPIAVHCIRSADIVPFYNFEYEGVPTRYISTNSLSKRSLQEGDIVIEKSGGTNECSTGRPIYISKDVLKYNSPLVCSNFCEAFRVKPEWNPKYIYYFLRLVHKSGVFHNFEGKTSGIHNLQIDAAFDSIQVAEISKQEQNKIVNVLEKIEAKISLNRSINKELETMAKQLYDYWFVQFDFPDANGKPYKSSGGEMVYNPTLKREIPQGWEVKSLLEIANFTNGLACQKFRPTDENKLPVIKIKEMHDGFTKDTEFVTSNIPNSVKVNNGDILFSWSATLEVMLWALGNGGLNQHIFKVTSKNGWPKSFFYFQLLAYVNVFKKMAEARKTTMGHITQDHLQQSRIVTPPTPEIANKLDKIITPIFDKIVCVSEEISLLTKQRDELLPLLMNGQVTIK